jgi:hypothetical protein
MKPDTRRQIAVDRATRRYGNAVRQGSIPCRADGDSAGQSDNYRTAAERSELRFTQVKQVLMERGVPPIQFVPYRNFALHLDKLFRQHSGETLRSLAASAVDYWTAYGLRPEVLRAITGTVFSLDLPNPSESCNP